MLGRSHVVLGALGWLAGSQWLPPDLVHGAGISGHETLAVTTVACAGAALLPDLDHPDGTIAQSLGPVTRGAATVLGKLFGGHRNASHGFLFAGVVAALVQLLQTMVGREAMAGVLFVLVAFAVRAVKPPRGRARGWGALLIGAQAALVTGVAWWLVPGPWPWMPYVVGVGCLLHLVGDLLTATGVPLFWPFRRRFSVPLLGFPGDGDEKVLASLMTGALAFVTIRTF
ncbi:MAG: metal-dependent hydrolase [Actinomycetes bacterium]